MASKTLAEQNAELSQTKIHYDIENNDFQDRIGSGNEDLESADEHARDHYVEVPKSKLSKPTSAIRSQKYNGKVVSREALYDDENSTSEMRVSGSDESEVGSASDDASKQEEEDYDSAASFRSNSDVDESSDEGSGDEESDKSENEEDEALDDAKRSRIQQILANERKQIVRRLSESATNDALKGHAIIQQQKEFDAHIDARLKIQKALNTSNLLPIDKNTLQKTEIASKKSHKYLAEATTKCYDLLDTIFALRKQLYNKEKVLSEPLEAVSAKRTLAEYLETTGKFDKVLNKYRGTVLTKWLAKIQNSSGSKAINAGKFKALNQSAEQQVINNLYDMDRLLKRTKLNRRNIKPLGHEYMEEKQQEHADENEKANESDDNIPEDAPKQSRSLNLQEMDLIFDDEDFYRVLLNDLVDKNIQSSDPTAGLLFVLKGAASTKLKKNVDNKASKGRKLSYHVQEKIANFDSPRPWLKWNNSQVDEFFASLLGQKISMKEESSDDDKEVEEDAMVPDSGIQLFG